MGPDELGGEEYGVLDEVECERLEREQTMCFLSFSSAVCLLSSCSEIELAVLPTGCGFYCVLLILLLHFFIFPVRSHLCSDAQYLYTFEWRSPPILHKAHFTYLHYKLAV